MLQTRSVLNTAIVLDLSGLDTQQCFDPLYLSTFFFNVCERPDINLIQQHHPALKVTVMMGSIIICT